MSKNNHQFFGKNSSLNFIFHGLFKMDDGKEE